MNPTDMSKAIRRLVNCQQELREPMIGPARQATGGLELPHGWLEALLAGWAEQRHRAESRGARLQKRQPFGAFARRSAVRFLEPAMLPGIDLRTPDEPRRTHGKKDCLCRLCGHTPSGRGVTWCGACWDAFRLETALGWAELGQLVYARAEGRCECGCRVDVEAARMRKNRERRTMPYREWLARWGWAWGRRVLYDIDHVIPLVDGGEHQVDNLRLLYAPCHARITGEAASRRAKERNGTDRQADLFGDAR